MASPEIKRVAFFGLGTMGWPMAANLARAGFDVSAWTHSEGKACVLGEQDFAAIVTEAEANVAKRTTFPLKPAFQFVTMGRRSAQ